jgi:hypothetical protein
MAFTQEMADAIAAQTTAVKNIDAFYLQVLGTLVFFMQVRWRPLQDTRLSAATGLRRRWLGLAYPGWQVATGQARSGVASVDSGHAAASHRARQPACTRAGCAVS